MTCDDNDYVLFCIRNIHKVLEWRNNNNKKRRKDEKKYAVDGYCDGRTNQNEIKIKKIIGSYSVVHRYYFDNNNNVKRVCFTADTVITP
jgi:hypothetical protein